MCMLENFVMRIHEMFVNLLIKKFTTNGLDSDVLLNGHHDHQALHPFILFYFILFYFILLPLLKSVLYKKHSRINKEILC
jgi:hypothetical protein